MTQSNNEIFSLSEEALNEIRNRAIKKAKENTHRWVQQGPYLVCKSCEFSHAVYIGTDKLFKGLDKKGKPIFETLKF